MNREELQQLAQIRLSDARALLATNENDAGAYYMAGYAIECALKAVIAKNQGIKEYEFPALFRRDDFYTHSITTLINTAGLKETLKQARDEDADIDIIWNVVERWGESYRYDLSMTRESATSLIEAIHEPAEGAIQWLQNYW